MERSCRKAAPVCAETPETRVFAADDVSIDPAFITRVRRKLGLDQEQAARVFGGEAHVFARYETGTTKPPRHLVELLTWLDLHPHRVEDIRKPDDEDGKGG